MHPAPNTQGVPTTRLIGSPLCGATESVSQSVTVIAV
jgi:hypothetical protein